MHTQLFRRLLVASLIALSVIAGSAPPASASITYTVTVMKVECIDRQDPWPSTNDEPRVTVNAMPIYSGSGYNDGTLRDIADVDVTVYDEFTFSIWEEDPWPDPDDYIGYKEIISADVVGEGTKTATVGTTNGKYKIHYRLEYR
jgi:hypothetical protein